MRTMVPIIWRIRFRAACLVSPGGRGVRLPMSMLPMTPIISPGIQIQLVDAGRKAGTP